MKPIPARPLTPLRRLALYAIGLGLWLSGGLWLLFHYALARPGPFGPSVNPLEPWWLKLHGAFAFAGIWFFGLLWGAHIAARWPYGQRRRSGSLLAGLFLWLIVSGYLLYYAGGEATRPMISLAHWVVGLAAPLAFVGHRLRRSRKPLAPIAHDPAKSVDAVGLLPPVRRGTGARHDAGVGPCRSRFSGDSARDAGRGA
jgi:hypothetical protein